MVGIAAGVISFAGSTAIIYLIVFNKRTRQSLHDLIMRTYVAKVTPTSGTGLKQIWLGHWAIMAALVLIAIAIGLLDSLWPGVDEESRGAFSLQDIIQDSGMVRTALVKEGNHSGPGGPMKSCGISAVWKTKLQNYPADYEKAAGEVAAIALSSSANVNQQDLLDVRVSYGYDIGLACSWRHNSCSLSPAAWRKKLEEAGNTSDN